MGKHRSLSLLSLTALAGVVFLLWPNDAYAWGPLAHLNFSSAAAQSASLFSPATRVLLTHFTNEFLYGSLAADIIVGKNLAKYAVHCHNWTVGFDVLNRAKTDAQKAFSLGFLSHLAVDTIAHNYYVPYKTVQSFQSRAAGHAYWEMRYDQRLPTDLWKTARRVCHSSYREHDEHLEECLADSYVIPFSISKKMFGSMLLAARLKKWQRMSEMLAAERDESLHQEEVRECEKLAVGQVVDMLKNGPSAKCTEADPTGGRNLHLATQMRTALKTRKDLWGRTSDELVRKSRPAFKAGIYGRLELPAFPDLAA
jgi:hypothetical protein